MEKKSPAREVALLGMLFALAIALSWLESVVSAALGLFPGVKLGLSNVVVMFALLYLSRGQALLLVVLKAGFALFTRGGVAAMLSLAGGGFSLLVMALLLLPRRRPSVFLLSVAGAICHNAGQLAVVALWLGQGSLYYGVVLLLSGIATGALNAVLLRALLPALERIPRG